MFSMSWARFGGRKEFVAGIFLFAMAISHVAMVFSVLPRLRRGYQDFTIFYGAGKMVRNGQSASLYNLSAQYRTQNEFAPDVPIRQAALPYNHPPFEALLFVPFTFIGYLPAYGIWTVLNLAILAISLALLRRHFTEIRSVHPVLLGLAAAGFFPIAMGMIQGQDSILLLLLTVLAMVAAAEGRDVSAGAVLALGLFKFHLMVPLVLLVAIKKPRLLVGFVPVALALVGVSVGMVGWHGTLDYVQFVVHLEKIGAGGAIVAVEMPNLHGLIADMTGAYAGSVWTFLLTVAGSVAVLLAAAWTVRKPGHSVSHTFALATVATMLIGYHTMPYDLSLLLPAALFLFVATGQTSTTGDRADMLLLFLLFLTPLYVFLGLHLNRLGWFALLLIWLFWRLTRATDPKSYRVEQAILAG
jgi:hypothetical protein